MRSGAKEREFTWASFLIGILLAVVFGAANAYLALKVGMTVSASIPAAVVSMAVLRLLLRRDSTLESNLAQTIGSAGESVAAGAVFTLPALFLWAGEGRCAAPDALQVTSIALVGGLLGVFFMVPVRRSLVEINRDRLPFPEGTACAEVLRSGERNSRGAGAVLVGFGSAAVVTPFLNRFAPSLSPALLGVGWIVGVKCGAIMLAGSLLGKWALVPLAAKIFGCSAADAWTHHAKYVAVGAIATAGLIALFKSLPTLLASFLHHRDGVEGGAVVNRRDLPAPWVWGGVAASLAACWALPQIPVGFAGTLVIAVFGCFFAVVAARVCGFIGSSNSPVSGMTIATLLFAAPLVKFAAANEEAMLVGTMTVGAIVCLVCSIAGDTCQDLSTGHLLGASPKRQQIGEIAGVVASSLAIGGVLKLMHGAWGFGSETMPAPQATLMKTIVECAWSGNLPWLHLLVGAIVASVAAALRLQPMAFAIGMYLPIETMAAVFAGGAVKSTVLRFNRRPDADKTGTLLSAGVIAGEGIAGIVLAILAAVGGF